MKFYELVFKYNWDNVKPILLKEYPDQELNVDGYSRMYNELATLQPETNKVGMMIVIDRVKDIFGIENWSVYGKHPNNDGSFAIEYLRWEKWLGLDIEPSTFKGLSETEILAHCLWEMTWAGFTQKHIQQKVLDIKQSVKNLKNKY